jgi:hypothetical protein
MIERPTQMVIPGELVAWVLVAIALTPILTAVVHDVMSRRWAWLFLDILLPPVGILRGVCIWFKWI